MTMGKIFLVTGLLLAMMGQETLANGPKVTRRAFLSACALGLGAAVHGKLIAGEGGIRGKIQIDPASDIDEMGLESLGQTVKQLLLARRWVPTEAAAEATRRRLQREVWAQIQRHALDAPAEDRALAVSTKVLLTLPAGELSISARFELSIAGFIDTERGREREVEAIAYRPGGEKAARDARRVEYFFLPTKAAY